jgi:hypothetical protein
MSDIACKLGAISSPVALSIYNYPLIIAKDCVPMAVNAPLSSCQNAISGSFSYAGAPCSILVSGGKTVHGSACHAHLYKPETVIFRYTNGTFGAKRVMYSTQLPMGISWAVGGLGLLGFYNPEAEGFAGQYSDVLRSTAHTLIGAKNGHVYLCYVPGMSAAQVNAHAKKLGFEYAVMLDGGHIAAINSDEKRINTGQKQIYIIKAR